MKNVVITGASSGVGESIALRLSSTGMKVFAWARNQNKLDALLAKSNGNIIPMAIDITVAEQIETAYAHIEADYGPIEVLINNAATFQMCDYVTQDLEMIDRIIDTNLKGTLYCTRFLLPYLLQRRSGRIINIASVAGTRGIAQQAAYCACKHGIVGFADALGQELLPKGILVTTLCPGGIDTPLWRSGENLYPGNLDEVMKPEEVAELIEFLLRQPRRTLYKKLIFFPTNEWH